MMSQEHYNPFAAAQKPNGTNGHAAHNPFQALEKATEAASPFAGVKESSPFGLSESEVGKPARLPERKVELAEVKEVSNSAGGSNPFEIYRESPEEPARPAAEEPARRLEPSEPAPMPSFEAQPYSGYGQSPQEQAFTPAQPQPSLYGEYQSERPSAPESPTAYAAPPAAAAAPQSYSGGMKQLELRAIFGVDHELSSQEIIQRARTLPGVRNVALIGENEVRALDSVKTSLANMGFGSVDDLGLMSRSGNVDFIQESGRTLVVMHEGRYAPGVRETLMIITRELARLA